MTSNVPLTAVHGKLPGKSLTKDNNGIWRRQSFSEVSVELDRLKLDTASRILSIESTKDRIDRLKAANKLSKEQEKKEKESFEVFASDPACNKYMKETLNFPSYLFGKTWSKSNGFAGSSRLLDGNISWFRLLVKMINSMDSYYWHEMTFFIHQLDGKDKPVTVLCFEVPDEELDPNTSKSVIDEADPYNFLDVLKKGLDDLQARPGRAAPDWRYMQSVLFRQAIVVVDKGVWACSNKVRKLEKLRPNSKTGLDSSFDFPRAHDLLRHALHSTEILTVASQNLTTWVDTYHADQRRQQRLQPSHAQTIGRDEDDPLPSECYHADLLATLQLLYNLSQRSASNDARLRNEINLAFNVVNQRDAKAVRIISIVTLTFLPATFVSTLFSMSFFNFQPPYTTGWGMSPWIWVYFVIAVPLTALTILSWIYGAKIWRWWKGG